jgi:hypothetical protein
MNYKITKLDKRYAHHGQFPYMIEFHKNRDWKTGTGVLDFDRCRRWFNEAWGWSQDIETREEMVKSKVRMNLTLDDFDEINCYWAYSCRYQEYRIYANETALTMFKLKWSEQQQI